MNTNIARSFGRRLGAALLPVLALLLGGCALDSGAFFAHLVSEEAGNERIREAPETGA